MTVSLPGALFGPAGGAVVLAGLSTVSYAVTGGPFLLAASVAVPASAIGLGLAQLACRGGGLGTPLATINLVDPMVAVALLGEPFLVTPTRIALGAPGLAATAVGIGALTRPHPPRPEAPVRTPHKIVTATLLAEEFEVAHVVR